MEQSQPVTSLLTSYQGLIFLGIQAQIQANVPEIKWIDMEMSQLENYGFDEAQNPRPPVDFPCLLIDFPQTKFTSLSRDSVWNSLSIEMRLGFAQFSNTSHITPQVWKEFGLQYFEIESKVMKAMDGYITTLPDGTPIHQPISRVSAATERRQFDKINMRVRSLAFTCDLEDTLAVAAYIQANPKLSITYNA